MTPSRYEGVREDRMKEKERRRLEEKKSKSRLMLSIMLSFELRADRGDGVFSPKLHRVRFDSVSMQTPRAHVGHLDITAYNMLNPISTTDSNLQHQCWRDDHSACPHSR